MQLRARQIAQASRPRQTVGGVDGFDRGIRRLLHCHARGKVFADPICITGSIGVYASLPNAAEFINRHGIKFELIKDGGIKASGSPFHELTPQERQPWQDMVDSSYDHFLAVVVEGRPQLTKEKLSNVPVVQQKIYV